MGFADDDDFDLAGVLAFVFDFVGDVAAEFERGFVADAAAVHEDADFASGVENQGFRDATETVGDVVERFDFLVVEVDGGAPGSGASTRHGIGRDHEEREIRRRLLFVVMGANGVNDVRFFAVLVDEVGADDGVAAFDAVIHGFTHIVQKTRAFCRGNFDADFTRQETAEPADFADVKMLVLCEGIPIAKGSEHAFDFDVQIFLTEFGGDAVAVGFDLACNVAFSFFVKSANRGLRSASVREGAFREDVSSPHGGSDRNLRFGKCSPR